MISMKNLFLSTGMKRQKKWHSALKIPIAGGEQEPSLHMFRWLIANDALQIVQPDMFYFGGMVRSMKVARMAAALGKECTPHISGSGLGISLYDAFCFSHPECRTLS